jgi:PhnB protein
MLFATGGKVMTQIFPMLAVSDCRAAIEFYKNAFDAKLLWDLDGAVAGLSIEGAEFFLADQSPEYGTRVPASAGFTTVRIELFVDDPVAVQRRAVSSGPSSTVRSTNTSTPQPGRALSSECFKVRLLTRSATCG